MATDARYEAWFNANGINYRYVGDVPLERFDREASLKNQARLTEVLDDDVVIKYGVAMENGAEFPPLVSFDAGGRYVLIGGNHRLAAAKLVGRKTFDSYVITSDDQYVIEWMTRAMNSALEGKAPSQDESLEQAVFLMLKYNKSAADVAIRFNLKRIDVEKAARRKRHVQRFEKLGVPTKNLPAAVIDPAGNIQMDKPLLAALTLRKDTGMKNEQFKELVRTINSATSEEEQLTKIAEFAKRPDVKQAKVESAGGRVRASTAIRQVFLTRVLAVAKMVEENPTPQALQLTSGQYIEQAQNLWRNTNGKMEDVFRAAKKSLNTGSSAAPVRAAAAKRR